MTGKPAVVLLSGGLDSTTVLAIAQAEGYAPYALSFRYGQRHSVELEAARRVAEAQGVARHVVADIDLRVFGGSALTDDIAVPHHDSAERPRATEIPVTYVPARNTIFLSFALAWAETLGASDIFIGVNALDYSGYPDCRPEYIEAYEQMANLATKAGVEGRQHLQIHTPLIELTKAQIIQRGLALGVDYSLTHSCYDPDAAGRACGTCDSCLLRRRGFAEVGMEDPALASSAEPADDLPGQGDLLHPAGRGHPRRAAGGVLPVHRLQPVDRPGAGPGPRDLPVLRHRLRRHRRAGRGPVRDRRRPGRSGRRRLGSAGAVARARPFVVCTGGEPLLQLDAGRRRGVACRRVRGGGRDQRHPERAGGPGLDLRQPQGRGAPELTSGDELKLVYPQEGASPEMFEDLDFPALLLQPMDGPERDKNTRLAVEYCLAHPAVAAEPADPQVPGDRVMEIFREFTFEAAHRLPTFRTGTSAPGCTATPTGSRSTWPGRSASRPAGSWTSRTSRTPSPRCTTNSTTVT